MAGHHEVADGTQNVVAKDADFLQKGICRVTG